MLDVSKYRYVLQIGFDNRVTNPPLEEALDGIRAVAGSGAKIHANGPFAFVVDPAERIVDWDRANEMARELYNVVIALPSVKRASLQENVHASAHRRRAQEPAT